MGLADYRHYVFFFFRKKSIFFFSTFLGINKEYHRLYKFCCKEKDKKPNISCFDGGHKSVFLQIYHQTRVLK